MKKRILIVVTALLAGVMAFCLMRSRTIIHSRENLLDSMPELAWVRTDLKLTDAQFAKVSELHVAYRPKCMEMCRRISDAHQKMDRLAGKGRELTPELEAAIRERAVIHAECQQAMLKHLYDTAAVLDEKQAARYLGTMIPCALDFTLSESENPHSH